MRCAVGSPPKRRGPHPELIGARHRARRLLRESEDLKALRNKTTELIGQASAAARTPAPNRRRMREVGERIKGLDAELSRSTAPRGAALQLPNLPHPSVPEGKARTTTSRSALARAAHVRLPREAYEEVGAALGLDLERAARIAKARFASCGGGMARLERALAQLMLDLHTAANTATPRSGCRTSVNGETMLQDGSAAEVRGAAVQDREADEGPSALPSYPFGGRRPDGAAPPARCCRRLPLPRRYTAFTPCLPARGGHVRQGHEGHLPSAQFDRSSS